jgi:hypothetical protein
MEPGAYVFVLLVASVAACMLYWRLREALPALGGWLSEVVKPSAPPAPVVMSREGSAAPRAPLSDLRQTAAQTDQTPAVPARPQPATLDTCRSLRAHGYTREETRALLRGVDRTLDNNVWAAAAPPPPAEPQAVTPYAGRPYDPSAYAYDEPGLRYEQPPA